MIDFDVTEGTVDVTYEPASNPGWVRERLRTHGELTISKAFTFKKEDLISGPDETETGDIEEGVFRFRFAQRQDGYFRIAGRILSIDNDVWITDRGIPLERKLFVAERNIGIFRRIAKVKQDNTAIVVGGNRDGAIPVETFRELLKKFPNSGELDRYASARVETIVGEFFDGMKSARENYETYLSERKSSVSNEPLQQDDLLQAEIDKYEYLRKTISDWLNNKAESYGERDWQRMIKNFILLLFPKYVAVLEEVKIKDFYSSQERPKNRRIDLCLVDAGGNIDVIEIKKPFDNAVISKGLYRYNHVPLRELSGSIMQAEKYIFHLSKWGRPGERELTERYAGQLPPGMELRITNPKAIIILGRDGPSEKGEALSPTQLFDLEVIKRKYANMMDIVTYDDLLRRLNNIIASLSQRKQN